VITKKELFTLWPATITKSENQLASAVSRLRKDLKEFDPEDLTEKIRNTPLKGYQFIGETTAPKDIVAKTSGDITAIETTPNRSVNNYKFHNLLLNKKFILGILLVAVTISCFNTTYKTNRFINEQISVKVTSVKELYDGEHQKNDVSFNRDKSTYMFSSKSENEQFWGVSIRNVKSGGSSNYERQGKDITNPIWVSQSSIVFKTSNEQSCSIVLLKLNTDLSIKSTVDISQCNPNSYVFSMAMLSNEYVYISESINSEYPAKIYKINIATGHKSSVNVPSGKGVGIYRVFLSPNKKVLATLTSEDYWKTSITLYDVNDFNEISSKIIDLPLASIALHNEYIIHQEANGNIQIQDHLGEKNKTIILSSSPTHSPNYLEDGFTIMEGSVNSNNISLINLNEQKAVNVTTTKGVNNRALFTTQQMAYYSSDTTGINQIWAYNKKTLQHTILTSVPTYQYFENVFFSDNVFAIESKGKISTYKYGNSKPVAEFNGINPTISGDSILYVKTAGKENSLWKYDIELNAHTSMYMTGVNKAINHNNQIVYTKQFMNGIWTRDMLLEEKLLLDIDTSNKRMSWHLRDNTLYINQSDKSNIESFNLQSSTFENVDEDCFSVFTVDAISCTTSTTEFYANKIKTVELTF